MNKSALNIIAGLLAGLLILSLVACGGGSTPEAKEAPPEPTSAAEPEAESQAAVETDSDYEGTHAEEEEEAQLQPVSDVEEGKILFAQKGCIACHGPEAEGTENAPALPGHTAEQIRRQVRDPLSKMPAFTEQQVSDAELEKIVAFITSLTPPEAMQHMHEYEMSVPVQAHLRMAILSLESDNTTDSQHHLQHAIEVADTTQAEAIQTLVDRLNGGDTHEVQHELEEMLTQADAIEGKTMEDLHLELAFSAMEAREIDDAHHHVEHFVETATGVDKLKGEQILELMDDGDLHNARHGIEGLLGMAVHSDH